MMSLLCGQQAFIPPLGVLLHAQRKVAHQLMICHPMAVSGGFWHHTSSQLPGMQAAVPCNVSVYRHASDTAIVLACMLAVQAHMVQARFCYLHLQAPPWAPANPCRMLQWRSGAQIHWLWPNQPTCVGNECMLLQHPAASTVCAAISHGLGFVQAWSWVGVCAWILVHPAVEYAGLIQNQHVLGTNTCCCSILL